MFCTMTEFEQIQSKLTVKSKIRLVRNGVLIYGLTADELAQLKRSEEQTRIQKVKEFLTGVPSNVLR